MLLSERKGRLNLAGFAVKVLEQKGGDLDFQGWGRRTGPDS